MLRKALYTGYLGKSYSYKNNYSKKLDLQNLKKFNFEFNTN